MRLNMGVAVPQELAERTVRTLEPLLTIQAPSAIVFVDALCL